MEKDQEVVQQPQQPQPQDNAKDQQIDYEKRINELEAKVSNLKSELFDMLVVNINQTKQQSPTPTNQPEAPKKILEDF
ncbi:MAG: hypothetical protein IKE91_08800 [Clostridia bacterium]|nr:hypothetical protein [Clostridia bacterium]MBR2708710.1 hypothetical protein [Bacilli bacterium]